ncbi:ANL family adenylate-forming protein [Aliarcobacter butzleri]|uniref:Fatty acid--CoA ligase family protein n=2 Tax=Aliarcobacter butzleri TaxID=28197 RepID=A0AAW7PTG6_9BACT|nr:fatty acid--CoA ligase family protein [Aliarcobacter butzleri]KLE09502.1 o-succinylbenzoate--CoA ligase [Aliarcobacter butzleri L355]MDN5064711.1 fatty acid--CoA ligase family protein [Aliarcobacter butzleri]MDN5067121.1 fatty acid--CoA ligase family protein [Aliarcobacter butzleri]
MINWIFDNFKRFGNKIAINYKNRSYTYLQLFLQIKKIEKEIISNVAKNEVVAIIGDYSFESIAVLFALSKNRNIIVPITSVAEKEIKDKIEESFCDKIIRIVDEKYVVENNIPKEKHQIIKDLQEKNSSGLILFSSGSTAKPKAMIHDFDILLNSYKNKKEKSLNMIVFLMFDHIGGLNTLLNILSIGSTMIIPENRNPDDICKLIQDYKITVLPSSPTFLNLILMNNSYKKYDLSSLKMITYGTETMPDSLLSRLKNVFPKIKFLQTFGTSETGIANTKSKASNSTFMKIEDLDLEYKIVENELWLKSKTQILGYLNSSMDSFTKDGWFKTGDLVETLDDGYIKIIGRNKEVINVGGQKVLPSEVESIILSMKEIEDCMVYGEKNIIIGETVVCDVVCKNEISNIKILIRQFCKDKLDNYKVPTKVNIVDKTNFTDRFKKIRRK